MINLVIPAAGAATRLRPLSKNTSKIMVRVNGKPTLDYIIEHAKKVADISEIIIVDGKLTDIYDYCKIKHPSIRFIRQHKLNGPRDAIKLGMSALHDPSKPVLVWLGDAIILEENLPFDKNFLLTKEVDDHSAWCMWDGDNFYNKPTRKIDNANALVGMYYMTDGLKAKSAFRSTEGYDISDALEIYSKEYTEVITNKWYDIGELSTYYKTSAALLNMKSRAFNKISYNQELNVITKTPDVHNEFSITTIQNEIAWYKALSLKQSLFVPRVLDSNYALSMSYESGTLLSDYMLYEDLTESTWDYILGKVFMVKDKWFNNYIRDYTFISEFCANSYDIWVRKTIDRLNHKNNLLSHSAKIKLKSTSEFIQQRARPISGMHGDLHFGNILFNHQTDQIRLIDPRGSYGNHVGIYGDDVYDYAKLAHDLYHGYNAMVANVEPNPIVKKLFIKKLKEYNLDVDLILAAGLLLLATCIPLHYDNKERQQRFIDYVEKNIEKYCI